jgi:hypothetical protein
MNEGLGPISGRGRLAVQAGPEVDVHTPSAWLGAGTRTAGASHAAMRRAFQRTLAGWVGDLLAQRPALALPDDDPQERALADYRDRDWTRLYRGSVLDD